MSLLFILVSILKLIVLGFFLTINWNDEGSTGWAFQHLIFVLIVFFIFLPLSFFEKTVLGSKVGSGVVVYIPLSIVTMNLIPYFLGSWSTKGFVLTQFLGMVLIIALLVIYFKPSLIR